MGAVYAVIFSWPVKTGVEYVQKAIHAHLNRCALDAVSLAKRRQKLIILTAEVLLVIIFGSMSQLGCFASSSMHAAEDLEEEIGMCAREVAGPHLISRFVVMLYVVELAFVETGIATSTEVIVLSGPPLLKATLALMIATGVVVLFASAAANHLPVQVIDIIFKHVTAACAIAALLVTCTLRQHLQATAVEDGASERIAMPRKRLKLTRAATMSALRYYHGANVAEAEARAEPQQLWTLQILLLLLSVLPLLTMGSLRLGYGYYAFGLMSLALFPLSTLGLFLQTLLNVELTPTPTKFERIHFWLWWACCFPLTILGQMVYTQSADISTGVLMLMLSCPLEYALTQVRHAVHEHQSSTGRLNAFVDSNMVIAGKILVVAFYTAIDSAGCFLANMHLDDAALEDVCLADAYGKFESNQEL